MADARNGGASSGYKGQGKKAAQAARPAPEAAGSEEGSGSRPFLQAGRDSDGKKYADLASMWNHELAGKDKKSGQLKWYTKAVDYWNKQDASIDGVLGGLGEVSPADLRESKAFLQALPAPYMSEGSSETGSSKGTKGYGLDLGAGIGRVSKNVILPLGFSAVDIVEPCAHMVAQAREELGASLRHVHLCSLQDLRAVDRGAAAVSGSEGLLHEGEYGLIVLQWVAIYLTDDDFVTLCKMLKRALRPGGIIFFKENTMQPHKDYFVVDKDDSSVTRTVSHYKHIFASAGLEIVSEKAQEEWPSDLLPVWMAALK
eukprot:TRINITY_DN60744_c0_g1_i1.p1 TRINITY_DN60744_c0_g1~~TRINITY_DN60744_c0_g1_i1.p1  ORF type:complete len:314 (-),score=94.93 TRINITY_DN60744_c0_g1_i1:213-1154(-)